MKNLIYLLLITIIFCSCETTVSKNTISEKYSGSDIEVLKVDNCEYLIFESDIRSVTHKGNCKYCLERKNKQYEYHFNLSSEGYIYIYNNKNQFVDSLDTYECDKLNQILTNDNL